MVCGVADADADNDDDAYVDSPFTVSYRLPFPNVCLLLPGQRTADRSFPLPPPTVSYRCRCPPN
eukprot:8243160-Lingulodinium_polyedra.AAC.1